jgi:hypothetical protein
VTHFLGWRRSTGWRLSFSGVDSSFLILASNHLITSQLQESSCWESFLNCSTRRSCCGNASVFKKSHEVLGKVRDSPADCKKWCPTEEKTSETIAIRAP